MEGERAAPLEGARERVAGGAAPAFAWIGAPKTGTTTVFHWLSEHPGVHVPAGKELHYFDHGPGWERGLDWYLGELGAGRPGQVAGEVATTYLSRPEAVEGLVELNPDIRLVISTRDPVDRAWSQYHYGRSRLWYTQPFSRMVQLELIDLAAGRMPRSLLLFDGLYGRHLAAVLDLVERVQVLVLSQADLLSDPLGTWQTLCRHLGVDNGYVPSDLGLRTNVTQAPRSRALRLALVLQHKAGRVSPRMVRAVERFNTRAGYPTLDPSLRRDLEDFFAEDQAAFAELLS